MEHPLLHLIAVATREHSTLKGEHRLYANNRWLERQRGIKKQGEVLHSPGPRMFGECIVVDFHKRHR